MDAGYLAQEARGALPAGSGLEDLVRVCVCVCARARACVREYVCVCVHARLRACVRVRMCL